MITKLDQGLSPELWQLPTGNQLSTQGKKAFHRLRDAIKELRKLKTPPGTVITAIQTLTGVGRTLAEQAVAAAITAGGNAKQLAKANKGWALPPDPMPALQPLYRRLVKVIASLYNKPFCKVYPVIRVDSRKFNGRPPKI